MAKIKSTLDIVMERTRNLTMTEDDRDALRKKDLTDRIRGWVQLLVDGRHSLRDLKSAYTGESAQSPEAADILRRELLGHIDPDTDNHAVLEAYEDVLGLGGGPVMEAVRAYREAAGKAMCEHRGRLSGVLAAAGVSGTAVVPNIQADPEWKAFSARMRDQFRRSLVEG